MTPQLLNDEQYNKFPQEWKCGITPQVGETASAATAQRLSSIKFPQKWKCGIVPQIGNDAVTAQQ
jgi:hypothetical protein